VCTFCFLQNQLCKRPSSPKHRYIYRHSIAAALARQYRAQQQQQRPVADGEAMHRQHDMQTSTKQKCQYCGGVKEHLIKLDCTHLCCKDCLTHQAETKANKEALRCVMCREPIALNTLSKALGY